MRKKDWRAENKVLLLFGHLRTKTNFKQTWSIGLKGSAEGHFRNFSHINTNTWDFPWEHFTTLARI